MSGTSPLQIAADTMEKIFGTSHQVPNDRHSFDCYFPSQFLGEKRSYALDVLWNPTHHTLFVSLGLSFDLSTVDKSIGQLCKVLGRSAKAFLDGDKGASLDFLLWRQSDGEIMPCVETTIDYAPLENDEIEREFAASFLQALFMLEILGPVFEQIELGYLPGPRERMRSMMVAYGFWETNIALEFSNGRTRLPPGLFGGIKELRLQ